MKHTVEHGKLSDALDNVRNGKSMLYVPTHTHCTVIRQKDLKRWDDRGLTLLREDSDGRGFRMAQGKGSVYLFAGQLIEQGV